MRLLLALIAVFTVVTPAAAWEPTTQIEFVVPAGCGTPAAGVSVHHDS